MSFGVKGIAQNTKEKNKKTKVVYNVNAATFDKLVKGGKGLILDVRTKGEYKQWHYEDAVLVNYFAKGFKKGVRKLDKSRPVYVYCHSGIRSGLSLGILKKEGFKPIYNLKGGTAALDKWRKKQEKDSENQKG